MAETDQDKQIELGPYARQGAPEGLSGGEGIALILSLVWIVAWGGSFLFLGAPSEGLDPLRLGLMLLVAFLPPALAAIGALALRAGRVAAHEAARLGPVVDALRQQLAAQKPAAGGGVTMGSDVSAKLDKIAEAQQKTEVTLAKFISIRPVAPSVAPGTPATGAIAPGEDQGTLELGTPNDTGTPLGLADLTAALQFPADPDDKEGFRALRKALQDRRAAQLITAAQDILTLLSQDGIYMDDLRPDRARPELWRRFAQGERGRTIAALGGIRDRSSLALASSRMRKDAIFRDAAHHFLRLYDRTFVEIEKVATDQEIADLSDTRTSRAFMLLGRVTGTFD